MRKVIQFEFGLIETSALSRSASLTVLLLDENVVSDVWGRSFDATEKIHDVKNPKMTDISPKRLSLILCETSA